MVEPESNVIETLPGANKRPLQLVVSAVPGNKLPAILGPYEHFRIASIVHFDLAISGFVRSCVKIVRDRNVIVNDDRKRVQLVSEHFAHLIAESIPHLD